MRNIRTEIKMALPFRNLFTKEESQAFPGDTYLADMHEAAHSGRPWAPKLLIGVALGLLADLFFLHDTVSYAFDAGSGDLVDFLGWGATVALVVLYLYIGFIFGKRLQDHIAFRDKLSLVSAIIALVILILTLASVTAFRLYTELGTESSLAAESPLAVQTDDVNASLPVEGDTANETSSEEQTYNENDSFAAQATNANKQNADMNEALSRTMLMTIVMLVSAILSAFYAYFRGDAVSEAVYRKSVAALPADRALYNRVFFEHSNDTDRERQYEERERELDKRAVESAFKLGSLASQLNGMVDPADAYEFLQVQRAITADYYGEGSSN